MRAWVSGDEWVVGKSFERLFNAGLLEEKAKDPLLHWCWQSNRLLGHGVVGPLLKKLHPLLMEIP